MRGRPAFEPLGADTATKDETMSDTSDQPGREQNKRGNAERLADRADAARHAGADATADAAETEALHTDPEGLANRLAAEPDGPAPEAADHDDDDAAVHAITGTVEPGSSAPSRAGISGSGSGADDM